MHRYIFFSIQTISATTSASAAVTSPHACQPFFKVEHRQQHVDTHELYSGSCSRLSLCHTGRHRSHHLVVCYRKRNPYRYVGSRWCVAACTTSLLWTARLWVVWHKKMTLVQNSRSFRVLYFGGTLGGQCSMYKKNLNNSKLKMFLCMEQWPPKVPPE